MHEYTDHHVVPLFTIGGLVLYRIVPLNSSVAKVLHCFLPSNVSVLQVLCCILPLLNTSAKQKGKHIHIDTQTIILYMYTRMFWNLAQKRQALAEGS